MCVASHVTEELRLALVHAPIPGQHTEDENALGVDWDQLQNHGDAKRINAQVIVLSSFLSQRPRETAVDWD